MYILISVENNESIKVFPTTDIKGPDTLQMMTLENEKKTIWKTFSTLPTVSAN